MLQKLSPKKLLNLEMALLPALVTVPPLHILLAEAGAIGHVAVGSVFQAASFETATRLTTPRLACQEESVSQSPTPLVTSFLTLPRKSPVVCLTLLAPEEEEFDICSLYVIMFKLLSLPSDMDGVKSNKLACLRT